MGLHHLLLNMIKLIVCGSEMEAVKFDVHLLKAVIKNGHKALTMYAIKCRQLVSFPFFCFFVRMLSLLTHA